MIRWVPAVTALVLVAVGLVMVATGRIVLPRNTSDVNVPTTASPSDPKDAVIAAVKEYYSVEGQARKIGDATLIDRVTVSQASPANVNFREFVRQQTAKNRRAVIVESHFRDWIITVSPDRATADFTFWLLGHDIDATTNNPVEADQTTPKGRYTALLRRVSNEWRLFERRLIADSVP